MATKTAVGLSRWLAGGNDTRVAWAGGKAVGACIAERVPHPSDGGILTKLRTLGRMLDAVWVRVVGYPRAEPQQ